MNKTETPPPTWYRRALSASLAVSCVIIAIGLVELFLPDLVLTQHIEVPLPSLIGGAVVGIVSIIGLLLKHEKAWQITSFVAYILLLATTAVGIGVSSNFNSKLIVLWMLVAVFSGLWGIAGIVVGFTAGVAFGVYSYAWGTMSQEYILIYVMAFLLPPIVSMVGLHRRKETATNEDVAYHALATQLSQVANKSEIVINAIGEGVIALDNTGTIDLINPAAQSIMGWEKQDAMGLDYRSVFKLFDETGDAIPDTGGPIQQVLNGGESVARTDLQLATGSGKKINVWLQVSSIGKFGNGAIVVFRDITNEISENNQRAEFVSTASHEMRTPVAAIEGYLGLALNPATAQIDDKARAYITKAHESAQHLGRLFQDLLDVSKAEDGRLKNEPKAVEVVGFAREIVSIMTPKAQEKGLLLVFEPDVSEHATNMLAPIGYAFVDPDHLREVMSNLIDNAVKYTKEGTVTVDVTSNDNKILITVKDTGIGIAREDIPHLFQKFYRIDNTDTREIGGTGLGLYLCRRLVESMDGRIWLDSEQGKGSTFNVELERIPAEKLAELQAAATQEAKPQA